MNRTLILFPSENLYYFNRIKYDQILVQSIFRDVNGLKLLVFRVLKKLNSKLIKLYYNSWYQNLKNFDKIIIFDKVFELDPNILSNIKKQNPTCELYYYSWNIIKNEKSFLKLKSIIDKENVKMYSYDNNDCQKYGINFNTIMYDSTLKLESKKENYDTFFLGFLKDKCDKLLSLYKLFKLNNLNPRIIIVDSDNKINNKLPFEYKNTYVNYYEYLGLISESKSILDITQQNQLGLSMRVMEAIFFNKKLISTNKELKNVDFYNENNIFIIDLNDINIKDIIEFLKKDFIPYSQDVIDYYSIQSWIERFKI